MRRIMLSSVTFRAVPYFATLALKRLTFPVRSHEDSDGERVLDFHSYFDRTIRTAELSALDPAALYPHGNSLVLTSVRG